MSTKPAVGWRLGVYVSNAPSPLSTPSVGATVTLYVSVSPFGSDAMNRTLAVCVSNTVTLSAKAPGGSFVTFTVTVNSVVLSPSKALTSKVSCPVQSLAGVYVTSNVAASKSNAPTVCPVTSTSTGAVVRSFSTSVTASWNVSGVFLPPSTTFPATPTMDTTGGSFTARTSTVRVFSVVSGVKPAAVLWSVAAMDMVTGPAASVFASGATVSVSVVGSFRESRRATEMIAGSLFPTAHVSVWAGSPGTSPGSISVMSKVSVPKSSSTSIDPVASGRRSMIVSPLARIAKSGGGFTGSTWIGTSSVVMSKPSLTLTVMTASPPPNAPRVNDKVADVSPTTAFGGSTDTSANMGKPVKDASAVTSADTVIGWDSSSTPRP